jgi:hypothetical protein
MNRHTSAATALLVLTLGLCGCANAPWLPATHNAGDTICPALDGRYANQTDGQGERLAAVLIGDVADAAPVRSVELSWDAAQQRLRVQAEGLPPVTLKRGADFRCDQEGLHLLRPSRGASLSAPRLETEADTFHTFRRGEDGALLALATPARPGGTAPTRRWMVLSAAR